MVYLSLIFSILFSLSANAVAPTSNYNIGLSAVGVSTSPVSNIPLNNLAGAAGTFAVFSLYGGDGGALTATDFYPFYKNGVAYQVTAGKTAYCFNFTANNAAAASFQFVSATASFAFGAASITGGVHMGGAAGKYPLESGASANVVVSIPGTYTFGASTFPGFQIAGNNVLQLHTDCYEN